MTAGVGWFGSVKTRVTLFSLAVFTLSLWTLSVYLSSVLRDTLLKQVSSQQFSVSVLVAAEINDQVEERLQALKTVAEGITEQNLADPSGLQAQLASRLIFGSLFNAGVFITDARGVAVASVPVEAKRVGIVYADRDYVQGALTEGRSMVGKPVLGRALKAPVIGMSAPIRDRQGAVIGVLAGITNLSEPSFLDKIRNNRFGKAGGYLIISREHRMVITATDKRRVMTPLAAPGVSPLNDRFMQGFEGSGVNVNLLGEEVLVSAKAVPIADWLLSVNLPIAEAYAPVRTAQQRLLVATLLLTVLAGALTWWILGRQLAPLVQASAQLARQTGSGEKPQPLPVRQPDEIGTLVGAFNDQLGALARQSEFTQMVARNIPGMCAYWTADLRCAFANHGYSEWFGHTPDSIQGVQLRDLMTAEMLSADEPHVRAVLAGKDQSFESEMVRADGTVTQNTVLYKAHHVLGTVAGYFVQITDSTEFKQKESALAQIANFDALTGLPNRRLLADRLTQAMLRSQRNGLSLLVGFIDLDGFKAINDRFGHAAGDELLIKVAANLGTVMRGEDTLARLGGDEFVLLLCDMGSREEGVAVLQRVLHAAATPVEVRGQMVGVSASIGVSLFPDDPSDANTLLQHADQAMYAAKQQGKNCYVIYMSLAQRGTQQTG